jgi:hypothetical protein
MNVNDRKSEMTLFIFSRMEGWFWGSLRLLSQQKPVTIKCKGFRRSAAGFEFHASARVAIAGICRLLLAKSLNLSKQKKHRSAKTPHHRIKEEGEPQLTARPVFRN